MKTLDELMKSVEEEAKRLEEWRKSWGKKK